MRKCHCTSNIKIKGIFRGFFQEGNLEHGCDPVGLIELEDGTIEAPCATSIQFDEPLKEVANDSASHNKERDVKTQWESYAHIWEVTHPGVIMSERDKMVYYAGWQAASTQKI